MGLRNQAPERLGTQGLQWKLGSGALAAEGLQLCSESDGQRSCGQRGLSRPASGARMDVRRARVEVGCAG